MIEVVDHHLFQPSHKWLKRMNRIIPFPYDDIIILFWGRQLFLLEKNIYHRASRPCQMWYMHNFNQKSPSRLHIFIPSPCGLGKEKNKENMNTWVLVSPWIVKYWFVQQFIIGRPQQVTRGCTNATTIIRLIRQIFYSFAALADFSPQQRATGR